MKMRFNAGKFGLILAVGFTVPQTLLAQDASESPYAVSGSCSSQGLWTRNALAHSNSVRQVIQKLKDNPACNGLKNAMEANLTAMDQNLQEIEQSQTSTKGDVRTLKQLPSEIAALRTFARENSAFKTNVMDLLLGKTVLMSAMSSQKVNGSHINPEETAASLQILSARTKAAMTTGLQLFNSTMAAFQEAQQNCFDTNTGAVIASGMVKVLNSFASSNEGMNGQLALSVQKMTQYLGRDKKYVDALRKLNDVEFISSMSCLVEITSEGYCDTVDALYLLDEVTRSQGGKFKEYTDPRTGAKVKKFVGINQAAEQRLAKGPLAGYYIMTQQMPVITSWIQKVQFGMTPQLPSEAKFQVDVTNLVKENDNQIRRLYGSFNFSKETLLSMPEFNSKQTMAVTILKDVVAGMMGSPDNPVSNFFSQTNTEAELVFGLLGMPIPDDVLGTGKEGSNSSYTGNALLWINNNYRKIPLFNSPEKVVETIGKNMERFIDIANKNATAYYNKYFIVDVSQVAADSLLGITSNVRDALVNVDEYLKGFQQRFDPKNGDIKDPSILPYVIDTRAKIGRVLQKYKELRKYSIEILQLSQKDPTFSSVSHKRLAETQKKMASDLLKSIYEEFEVRTARTGFLSNRVAGIVLKDYTITLQKRTNFNSNIEDLMLSTGLSSLNAMFNLSEADLTRASLDLSQSMVIYKTSIDALEDVVTGVYVRNIFNNRIKSMNLDLTKVDRNKLADEWAYKMAAAQVPGEDSNAIQRRARGILNRFWSDLTLQDQEFFDRGLLDKLSVPLLQMKSYVFGSRGKIISNATGTFNANKKVWGYLCAQTLAFANFGPYWALCEGSSMDSDLMKNNIQDPEVQAIVKNYLSFSYTQKAYEHIERNKAVITGDDRGRNIESRICATRDFHRRNRIVKLTSAMRDDGDTYESPFFKSVIDELQPTPLNTQLPTLPPPIDTSVQMPNAQKPIK